MGVILLQPGSAAGSESIAGEVGILLSGVVTRQADSVRSPASHSKEAVLRSTNRARLLLALLLIPMIAAGTVAAVSLWPHHRTHAASGLGASTPLVNASVVRVDRLVCPEAAAGSCMNVTADVTSGPDRGQEVTLSLPEGPGQPELHGGDKIVLGRSVDGGQTTYYFADFQRRAGLWALAAAFAVLIVLIGRWRGMGALVGLAVTWVVLTQFTLPSILEGHSPVAVALTSSAVIVIFALYIAHGLSGRTTTAVIGTLGSLAIVGGLSALAVELTHLTGLANEQATYVQSFAGSVNIHGLLLAGMIIGALGVLNDMTVTQSSAVWEIHAARPGGSRWALYRSGMRVGRDHIASTVYTLVLAYAGAALPLLILFTLASRPWAQVVTTDLVAEEVVRALVGGIGIALSVPLTTALAAVVVRQQPVSTSTDEMGDDTEGVEANGVDIEEDAVADAVAVPAETGADTDDEPGEVSITDITDTVEPIDVKPVNTKSIDLTESERGRPELRPFTFSLDDDEGQRDALDKILSGSLGPRRSWFARHRKSEDSSGRAMTRRERKFWEEE